MDYIGLDDDQYEEFLEHFAWLWDTRMDHEQVEFKEVIDLLPFYSNQYDKDFRFVGETAEQMANNFFKEYADDLFNSVIEDREHEQDMHSTDEYHARLCY